MTMIQVPGATFRMGSTAFYPDEGPAHERMVAAFELDSHPVTNQRFAEFVEATGHTTVAEEPLDSQAFPDLKDEDLAPGSMVFRPAEGPVDLCSPEYCLRLPARGSISTV